MCWQEWKSDAFRTRSALSGLKHSTLAYFWLNMAELEFVRSVGFDQRAMWSYCTRVIEMHKRRIRWACYFLGFGLDVDLVVLAGFIGLPQHTKSHVAQPHGSSTKTTSPHSSHLYLSPFFFKIHHQQPDIVEITCVEISSRVIML